MPDGLFFFVEVFLAERADRIWLLTKLVYFLAQSHTQNIPNNIVLQSQLSCKLLTLQYKHVIHMSHNFDTKALLVFQFKLSFLLKVEVKMLIILHWYTFPYLYRLRFYSDFMRV